ncbi:hypothetical protein Efla_000017 [Eimeria flavescens]
MMALREHLYLALHGFFALLSGRPPALKLPALKLPAAPPAVAGAAAAAACPQQQQPASPPAAAAAAAAAAAERRQVLLEGPLLPYDFNWVSAIRASYALRAAVRRSLQQQQQRQQRQQCLQQQTAAVRDLLQQLRYCNLVRQSFLTSQFAVAPLEALLDQLADEQQQQQQQEQQQQEAADAACCRAPTAAELKRVADSSAAFRRAVERATTSPELIVPASCLEGKEGSALQRLFKKTKRGDLRQLRAALRQQQQQRQQRQDGRPTVDQWLSAALSAYGRGLSDLSVASWFEEEATVNALPAALAKAYGLQLLPLVKKPWKGFGRSFCGFPYRGEVFAVFDGEALDGGAPPSSGGAPHSSGVAAANSKQREGGLLSGAFSPFDLKAACMHAGFVGFLYFYPFAPLRISHFFSVPQQEGFPFHLKLAKGHHAIHLQLQPPKFRQARLLDLQELKIMAHELGHAFKEMLQERQDEPVEERPLDFDETFALMHEHLLRRPELLRSLSRRRETDRQLSLSEAKSLSVDLVDLLHPNSPLISAAIDFALHSADAFSLSPQGLERLIRQAVEDVAPYRLGESFPLFSLDYLRSIEGMYSGALVCYVLAELRALRVLSRLEKAKEIQHPSGAPLPDLRSLKKNLLSVHPKEPLSSLLGNAATEAAVEGLVRVYTRPKKTQPSLSVF